MKKLKKILDDYDLDDKQKFVTREFQDYGLRLAHELRDEEHKSLYIRLAKQTPRPLLEEARIFVKDQSPDKVRNRARLFMWKLAELRKERRKVKSKAGE
jgi:hypothetical protein